MRFSQAINSSKAKNSLFEDEEFNSIKINNCLLDLCKFEQSELL